MALNVHGPQHLRKSVRSPDALGMVVSDQRRLDEQQQGLPVHLLDRRTDAREPDRREPSRTSLAPQSGVGRAIDTLLPGSRRDRRSSRCGTRRGHALRPSSRVSPGASDVGLFVSPGNRRRRRRRSCRSRRGQRRLHARRVERGRYRAARVAQADRRLDGRHTRSRRLGRRRRRGARHRAPRRNADRLGDGIVDRTRWASGHATATMGATPGTTAVDVTLTGGRRRTGVGGRLASWSRIRMVTYTYGHVYVWSRIRQRVERAAVVNEDIALPACFGCR